MGGFTFHHVEEQAVKVPYRYIKQFKGLYIDSKKNKKIVRVKFYARDLKVKYNVYISKKLDEELLKKRILKRKVLQGINFDILDLQKTFGILTKDLRTKKNFFDMKY